MSTAMKKAQRPGGVPDAEVTQDDQQRINAFGRLNGRMHELEAEIAARVSDLADFEDAGNELMLADEEQSRYLVGECFMYASPEAADEHVQKETAEYTKQLEGLKQELSKIQSAMAELKEVLYSKFGDSINLEE